MRKKTKNLFGKAHIQKPSEIVMQQIRKFISSGALQPGDYLPPERELSEALGVGRGHVREALKQLQFFGVLEVRPQDGTVVADVGIRAFDNLIANMLKLERGNFQALLEVRSLLEVHAARLVALRANDSEIEELVHVHESFRKRVAKGSQALEEDMNFHIKIADLCKNAVLASLIRLIMPEVLRLSEELDTCHDGRAMIALEDHTIIVDAIYSNEVWTGVEYQVASHLMMLGEVEKGLEIVKAVRKRYDGRIR